MLNIKNILALVLFFAAELLLAQDMVANDIVAQVPSAIPFVVEQQAITVRGLLLEKGTKKKIANQRLYVRRLADKKMVVTPASDDNGIFSFSLVPGKYQIIVALAGYDKYEQEVLFSSEATQKMIIRMMPQVINPYNIVIHKKKAKSEVSEKIITSDEAASIPGNNRDVLQAVTTMPGVTSVSVFNGYGSGLVIRGSAQEDSLFLLADQGISSLYHFGGLESVIEPEFIESIEYNAGGFSAEYGNTLGGVVAMVVRNPRQDRFGGYVNLSLLSSSFMVEGPIGERDTLAFSLKRGFLDQYMRIAEKFESDDDPHDGEFEKYPVYYDGSFIYRHEFNKKNDLRFIGLSFDDSFKYSDDDDEISERYANEIKYSLAQQCLVSEWNLRTDLFKNVVSLKIENSQFVWDGGPESYFRQKFRSASFYQKNEYRLNKNQLIKSGFRFDFGKISIDSKSFKVEKEGEIDDPDSGEVFVLRKDFSPFYPSVYVLDQIKL